MQSEIFIQSLTLQTNEILRRVEPLFAENLHSLTWKADENTWSILECIEHLNLYGDFYLPLIQNKIKNSDTKSAPEFNSGLLGGYFTNSMLPKNKMKKMKTFKDKNPLNASLDKATIERFINQQTLLIELLSQSKKVNLNKIKIPTSISNLIKLKLGDVFQFYINHILRHLAQIEKIQNETKKPD